MSGALDRCPDCDVDLEDRATEVWCPRCTREWRDVEDPRAYNARAAAIAERDAWCGRQADR